MKKMLMLNVVLMGIATLVFTSSASAVLVAGWEKWSQLGASNPAVLNGLPVEDPPIDSGITATSANQQVSSPATGSVVGFWGINNEPGSLDGTWGALITDPVADTTNDALNDGTRLTNGGTGYYDFTLTDTSGVDRELSYFHFDSASKRPNSARAFELSVLSGDLTVGSIIADVVPRPAVGGTPDWYNIDIPLGNLADNVLDANGTVTFRLEFTTAPGSNPGGGGHDQFLDNLGISSGHILVEGDFNLDGSVNAADYTVWRDNIGATEDGSVLNGNGDGGTVGSTDYDLWVANFGRSYISPSNQTPPAVFSVPEPTATLLGLMAAAIGMAARRR